MIVESYCLYLLVFSFGHVDYSFVRLSSLEYELNLFISILVKSLWGLQ